MTAAIAVISVDRQFLFSKSLVFRIGVVQCVAIKWKPTLYFANIDTARFLNPAA